ncbi:MAG: tRNA guanosine(15) transglycosylase TgtA [Methanophagales archaeon ANME-1-THS]|nr:MAG: tRNA guanosine(15) transglycosylase TgtA [Methanophagales archaeon ANME-1-THS]
MIEFEIRHKDLMGRIGRLRTPHGSIETPTIMPVVNPNLMTIGAEAMKKFGAEMLITNAYIIYRKPDLRAEALNKGLHALLGSELPVMTDSGSYQLSEYEDVEVSNWEILEFQQRIGSDICVPLDIPTPPRAERERARTDLEETMQRMCEARGIISHNLLAGVVQGSTFVDLREESATRLAEIGFDVYAIGGVVPLLESYTFAQLVDIIMASKMHLPLNAPVHLFGAGHPMIFPLAVALGCDLFDSAAYALYAKGKRYITSDGTKKVEDLLYLPCSCPVCSSFSVNELKESVDLLASHNLWVTFEEMRIVKQSIVERSLWELCDRRCRAYPALLDALKQMTKYSAWIEHYDAVTKHTFFYLGESSAQRPEVLRYANRLNRFTISGKVLLTTIPLSHGKVSAEQEQFDHLFFVKPPFGPCPLGLEESYPVGQSEIPVAVDDEAKTVALQNVIKLMELKSTSTVNFVFLYDRGWEGHPLLDEIRTYAEVRKAE